MELDSGFLYLATTAGTGGSHSPRPFPGRGGGGGTSVVFNI
jgi:hypothetical protein